MSGRLDQEDEGVWLGRTLTSLLSLPYPDMMKVVYIKLGGFEV